MATKTKTRKPRRGSSPAGRRSASRSKSAADPNDLREVIRCLPGYDPNDQADGFRFDEEAAQRAIDFIQECIKLAKGSAVRFAGEPFILVRWQKAIVANLFGWYGIADGARRFRESLIYVGKKNGKTAFVAAILLLVLSCEGEVGGELYSAAASRDQAALLFDHAKGMVQAEPELSSRLTIYGAKGGSQQRAIVNDAQSSSYKCLSADADTVDGVSPSFFVADEVHRHPDAELIEVLQKSTAARRQPLAIYTTTADYNRPSPCNRLLKRAKAVMANKGNRSAVGYEPRFLPVVYEASAKDDWTSPAVWAKSNPNLGVTLTEEFLATECKKAQENPTELNNFLRLHLNIVTDQDEAWIPMDRWERCAGLRDGETPGQWRTRMLAELKGEPCFVGTDLSAKIDLTAVVQIFRPRGDRKQWVIIPHFWVPADTATVKERADRVPYSTWAREGLVTLTDDSEIDQQAIRAAINAIDAATPITELAYDEWNATELSRQLREEDGFGERMVVVRQGTRSLGDPMKEFEAMVLSRRIAHGGNPVMGWMVGNLCVKFDDNGNPQPSKRKSTGKIDGPVATFTGMARALAAGDGDDSGSAYEHEKPMVL